MRLKHICRILDVTVDLVKVVLEAVTDEEK